jgi:hypothetical protein
MQITEKEYNYLSNKKIFYKGVIEDNNDPLQIGRCRVRVLGIHSESYDMIPVDTLPWAHPINPLVFGSISGVGIYSVPVKGTWVWVFFDNDDFNLPIIMGAILGNNTKKPDIEVGFRDPQNKYPKKLGTDFNDKVTGTSYLLNNVIETKGGHYIQLYDGGSVKVHHVSGSYVEILASGDIIINSIKNLTMNVAENTTINTTGDTNIVSAGNINMTGATINLN